MLTEVNVENIQGDETSMLREVNVERCEVVAVNICYFTACFLWMATGEDYYWVCIPEPFEETLSVISNTWILICRQLNEQFPSLGNEQCK